VRIETNCQPNTRSNRPGTDTRKCVFTPLAFSLAAQIRHAHSLSHAVDLAGVLDNNDIEPAAAARAASRGTELVADATELLAKLLQGCKVREMSELRNGGVWRGDSMPE
jgi:hypothetical protein